MKHVWLKKGLIFSPHQQKPWMVSHASLPFAEHLIDDYYRVYCSIRDAENKAHGGYVDISLAHPSDGFIVSQQPLISPGPLGCFDDAGTMPSCIVSHQGTRYLYYVGWSRVVETGFAFFIGLALSHDEGKTYQKYSLAPIFGRTFHDPYLTASPWVMVEPPLWRMWYVSGVKWEKRLAPPYLRHYYHIKYAESRDGIHWKSEGQVCIDFDKEGDEYALARPVVRKVGNLYTMWYSYRGGDATYRIGYAESRDGISWQRKDDLAGITVSDQGWDSEMICYPFVFKHGTTTCMLYNGNAYGKTGFGYAILEENS